MIFPALPTRLASVHWIIMFPLMALATQLTLVGFVVGAAALALIQARRAPRSRWPLAVWAGVGALIFTGGAFLLGNVFHVFGEFTLARWMIIWVGLGGAGIFLAVGFLKRQRGARRWWNYPTAVLLALLSLLMGSLGVNREVGYFVNINQILAMATTTKLPQIPHLDVAASRDVDLTSWTPTTDQPATGKMVQARIPGTVSGFMARPAIIYLPPAALVKNPPRLPLLVAIHGQPGSPQDIYASGDLENLVEEYQKSHGGVAPIIVAPDLLSSPQNNPMCLDTEKYGNSKTYMMSDVMSWIHANLPVLTDAAHTAFLGFSYGGTCVVQFAAEFPSVMNTIVPIAPQLEPTVGSKTVARAFGGDEKAYRAVTPLELVKKHGPYPHLRAAFYVGEDDEKYTAYARTLIEAFEREGARAMLSVSPGTGHNWRTAKYSVGHSFPFVITQLGLPS